VPAVTPLAPAEGPKARDTFQNVKVLGDLSVAEFTRHMAAITQWVSPEQGCNHCHDPANLAADTKYQKVVSRRMLEMTQHLNADWGKHVGATGVTCYTCHRGRPVPEQVWFTAPPHPRSRWGSMLGNDFGQNRPSIGLAAMHYDPFTDLLAGQQPIRVAGPAALPNTDYKMSIQSAEKTYSLMMHFSESLGVNCTFCHNTHSFQVWDSPPQRTTAWHGIRMARDLNNAYLTPLTTIFPKERLGPAGDVAKVYCATCHQGQNKPLGGAAMAAQYVGLTKTAAKVAAAPALPPPVSEATKSVLYFGVGSAALEGAQAEGLNALLAEMKAKPRSVATISGYHSASGMPDANRELAKQRAFAVRDALLAGGVAADRVRLEKPQQTEANVAGEDPVARRVEVTLR
jgi:photosynthetic reaction center cytochrome c subunit